MNGTISNGSSYFQTVRRLLNGSPRLVNIHMDIIIWFIVTIKTWNVKRDENHHCRGYLSCNNRRARENLRSFHTYKGRRSRNGSHRLYTKNDIHLEIKKAQNLPKEVEIANCNLCCMYFLFAFNSYNYDYCILLWMAYDDSN